MKKLLFSFSSTVSLAVPVKEHDFLLRILPWDTPEQKITNMQYLLLPEENPAELGKDSFNNPVLTGRVAREHRAFSYQVQGELVRDDRLRYATPAMPCYRFPTKLTTPSKEMLAALKELNPVGTPIEVAEKIAKLVTEHFTYTPGATGIDTTATEAWELGQGVCQDYSHAFLALARAAGLTARYVSGLPIGQGATHAWVEVWQDGLWEGFDPTRDCRADEGYIRLAVGRDYSDCPPERGTFQGYGVQQQKVFMQVSEI